METEQNNKRGFYLKWPWNAVVYIVLAVLLRLFAIPVILLLMAWNKKQQPDGPEEGYCLQRTHRRLARLVWALLFLAIGFCCGVVFVVQVREDRAAWEISDYATLAVCGFLALAGLIGGIYEAYTDLRDAFFPEKSRLARSIRAQLRCSESELSVKELFAMVDQDIRENGQWFDRVAVGKEWVLGDDASLLSNIRVVAGRNEVVRHHSGGRVRTARYIDLYIVDDRREVQITGLRDPKELDALLSCLRLRVPAALFVPYKDLWDSLGKEEDWPRMEREYQSRLARLESDVRERRRAAAQSNPHFVFTDGDGQRTSRFDANMIAEQIGELKEGDWPVGLEALEPILVPERVGEKLTGLSVGRVEGELILVAKLQQADGTSRFLGKPASDREIQQAFSELLEQRRIPDLSDTQLWRPLQRLNDWDRQEQRQMVLTLTDDTGTTRDYNTITRRDVELAAAGLSSGKYSVACLRQGAEYLYLQREKSGEVTVNFGRPDQRELRVFETKCAGSQAEEWLMEMADGRLDPDVSQWKEITDQLKKLEKKR